MWRVRRPVLSLVLLALAVPAFGAASAPSRAETREAERKLAELGFWTGPIDGVWDEASRQALVAFQKLQHAKPTGRLTRAESNALSLAAPPLPREPRLGPHVEVDLARQVLFLVSADGKAGNVVPISSGSGRTFHEAGYPATRAVTPCGHLEVYAKVTGWKTSPLGVMHNPMYIVGGIAIHGSQDMRTYPASHGCIRIPMFASHRLTKMVPKGTPVIVYGCADEPIAPSAIAVEARRAGGD